MTSGNPVVLVGVYDRHPYWNLPFSSRERLESEFPELGWVHAETWFEQGFGPALADALVLFGWHLPPEEFPRAKRLRWIQSAATGVRRLLYPALVESEIVLTCARTVHAPFLAEQVMAWVLAHARRLGRMREAQGDRRWIQDELLRTDPPETLLGRMMVIVGYGAAGRELAVRARAFGMRVVAVKRRPETGSEGADEVTDLESAERWLAEADVVVNLLPNTDRTRGYFDRRRLGRIRPGAFFVNVGRGTTVDENALAERLRSGALAGAGLDVFAREPLASDSPLWKTPGTWISPHLAGVGHPVWWERLTDLFARNLHSFLEGKPLEQVVDKRSGY